MTLLDRLWEQQGYNPKNMRALAQYKAGAISIDQLWREFCNNLVIEVGDSIVHQSRPYPGDRIMDEDGEGTIEYIAGEVVGVRRSHTNQIDELQLDQFETYDSTGGRTKWLLY